MCSQKEGRKREKFIYVGVFLYRMTKIIEIQQDVTCFDDFMDFVVVNMSSHPETFLRRASLYKVVDGYRASLSLEEKE